MPNVIDNARMPELVRRYDRGASVQELADLVGVSYEPMRRKLKKAGVAVRSRGKANVYELNEDYFEVIDTEEKAYWLGFLLADGCVDSSRGFLRCSLQLANRDAAHVEKFRKAVGSNAPIERTRKGARLQLSRPRFCEHLIRHGCIPNKTAVHDLPHVPPELYRHLFRGIFDGDGSIYRQGQTCKRADGSDCRYFQWRASFVGSKKFVQKFQAWIRYETGLKPRKLEKRNRVVSFAYGSTRQTGVLLMALYKDATVYLDRKYAKYLQVMHWLDANAYPKIDTRLLVKAYEAGATVPELAKLYKRGRGAIRKQLYTGNARMRPRGHNRKTRT